MFMSLCKEDRIQMSIICLEVAKNKNNVDVFIYMNNICSAQKRKKNKYRKLISNYSKDQPIANIDNNQKLQMI